MALASTCTTGREMTTKTQPRVRAHCDNQDKKESLHSRDQHGGAHLVRGCLASSRGASDHHSETNIERVEQLQDLVDVQRHTLQAALGELLTNGTEDTGSGRVALGHAQKRAECGRQAQQMYDTA